MSVAGLRKPDRWHGVLAVAVLAGLVAASALSVPATAIVKLRAAPAASGAGCGKARGPFHVKGAQVIGRGGKAFIPYGITVAGLFSPPGYSAATRKADFEKIAATASLWCANTVRLQISQAALVGRRPIPGFFKDIENEVSAAEGRHLVVVLNDQTELDPGDPPLPTGATLAFWKKLANRYRTDPQVIFDLYNEPRFKTARACGSAADWRVWKQGTGSFIGTQNLVNHVISDEAPKYENLLWVEGPCFAITLSRLTSYLITSKQPLVVYDFHHPTGPHNPAQWDSDFGYLVKRHVAAVVDGEWTNYAPLQVGQLKRECWNDAPTAAPAYLSYLQRLGVGMTAFDLGKGLLIESLNLGDPTKIRSDWSCAAKKVLDEGVGSLIMNWYKTLNAA